MPKLAWIVIGAIVTAGLGCAAYWVWLEVQAQIRGTILSSFGIFAAVLAAFALLSVAQAVIGLIERRLEKDRPSTSE